jgi:hypothetical protein
MFAKVFGTLFSSTINDAPLHVRWTWIALISIPQDEDGVVDMTPQAIARFANLPVEQVTEALDYLAQPDPMSRSDAEEGRRLVPIRQTYGWRIVNFKHYRNLKREADRREYMREYMRARRGDSESSTTVSSRKHLLAQLADTEAEAEAEANKPSRVQRADCDSAFNRCWNLVPRKEGRQAARKRFDADVKAIQTAGGADVLKRFSEYTASLEASIRNYAEQIRLNGTERRFVKTGGPLFTDHRDYVAGPVLTARHGSEHRPFRAVPLGGLA